jgi:PEP-CTERM motif
MFLQRILIGAACAVASFLIPTLAQADPIVWTLENVAFSDAGTASGTFTIDSSTGDLLDWDVTTVQTTTGYTGFAYNSSLANSNGTATADSIQLYPAAPNAPHELNLLFSTSLLSPGVDSIVTGASSFEDGSNCCQTFTRTVTSGEAVSVSPEPATGALLFAGIGLFGWMAQRRRKTV